MKFKFFDQPILVFSVLTALLLAATEAPPLTLALAVGLIFWKWLSESKGLPVLPRSVTGALSVLLWLQVYLQYKTILGQESSNALLMGMAALKIMDYENQRDHRFLIMISFVVLSMKAIFSIDLYWVLPSLLSFAALWWALLDPQFKNPFPFLVKVFVASAPIVMILFFIFPRFVVPWAMQNQSRVNAAGFSGQLDPGGVAELASSDKLAFRAKFENKIMIPDSLYWRGSVLMNSEGLRWTPSRHEKGPTPDPKPTSDDFSYEVILEPGSEGYLFTLDFAKEIFSEKNYVISLSQSVFRFPKPITRVHSYRVLSNSDVVDRTPPQEGALKVPKLSPRIQAWVDEVKMSNPTPKDRLLALRRFFSESDFIYTIRPGSYDKEPLESFLFERKRGFCEHFAGAFGTLARALGLPARVVAGYQGGLYNPFGDFWRVSQRDAHAWVEVFIDERWVRNDPTAWVAPLRINLGGQSFFNLSEEEQRSFARSTQWNTNEHPQSQVWDALSFWLEDINYQWTHFLLNFDSESQKDLLAEFSREMGLFFLAGILFTILLLYLMRKFSGTAQRRLQVERQLDKAIQWGESQGIIYENSRSPLPYLTLLSEKFPEKKEQMLLLRDEYDSQIYKKIDR